MMRRHRFHIASAGAGGGANVAKGDSGLLYGAVEQMRWYSNVADTGCPATLQLGILPSSSDSGVGWLFYNESVANIQATGGFTKAPRQPQHGSDGAADPSDTGAAFGVPVVGCNDRLRVKVIPGDTGVVLNGALYVWSRD